MTFFPRSARICFFKSVNRRLICFDAGMSHRTAATASAPLRTGAGDRWGGRLGRGRAALRPPLLPPVCFARWRRGWLPRRVGLSSRGRGGTPGRRFCRARPLLSPSCGQSQRLSLDSTGLTRGRPLC